MAEETSITYEMTEAEYRQMEHEIQTGVRDTLPDGRKISDVQKSLAAAQKEQHATWGVTLPVDGTQEDSPLPKVVNSVKVEVIVAENGVMSARPIGEGDNAAPIAPPPINTSSGDTEPENDLPSELPGRKALIAAGVMSLETVATLGKDALVAISGIGEKTADEILAYGKADIGAEE